LALNTEAVSEGESVCSVEFEVEDVVANAVVHRVDWSVHELRRRYGSGRVFTESNDPELFGGRLNG